MPMTDQDRLRVAYACRGRPREIPDRVKLDVYLTADERDLLTVVAAAAQMSTSSWVRRVACECAMREQERLAQKARRPRSKGGRDAR